MNPVFLADLDRDEVNTTRRPWCNIYVEVTPVRNLMLRTNFGSDYTENYDENIERTFRHGFITRLINSYSVAQRHRLNWTWSNTATIPIQQGNHTNILAGMEATSKPTQIVQTIKRVLPLKTGILPVERRHRCGNPIKGFSPAINCSLYFGKQIIHSVINTWYRNAPYDGSSRFGGAKPSRYGPFPAASVGWVLSGEEFMKKMYANTFQPETARSSW